MNYTAARNPQATEDGMISLLVTFDGIGEVPFMASPLDQETHGRELYTRALAGDFGSVAPYVAPQIDLVDLAYQKQAEIQAEKCRVRDGGVMVDGIPWDSDMRAWVAYMGTAMQMAADPTFTVPYWKASTGYRVTMDASTCSAVISACKLITQQTEAWQAGKEAEIQAALSADDRMALEAITTTYI